MDADDRLFYGVDEPAIKVVRGARFGHFAFVLPVGETEFQFRRHPELYRQRAVRLFADEWHYCEQYGTNVDYRDRSARWIEAGKLYRDALLRQGYGR